MLDRLLVVRLVQLGLGLLLSMLRGLLQCLGPPLTLLRGGKLSLGDLLGLGDLLSRLLLLLLLLRLLVQKPHDVRMHGLLLLWQEDDRQRRHEPPPSGRSHGGEG